MRCLECHLNEEFGYEGPEVVCKVSILSSKVTEIAGRAFFEAYESRAPEVDEDEGKEEAPEEEDEEEGKGSMWESWFKKKRHRKTSQDHLRDAGNDLYKLLGITECASVEEIRKAYRKLVLLYHPDKKGKSDDTAPKCREKESAAFIKIHNAYETLSDPAQRRKYDSSIEFDDSIPNIAETVSPEKFFELLGAVFERNSRWSKKKPVPTLGSSDAPMNVVHAFYDFWKAFDSWRDFSMHHEYNLQEAECRDEKRWMERENAKVTSKHVKAERNRIRKIVDLAYSRDPRIRFEREETQRLKKEREEAALKLQQEEERRKKEEAEEARRKAEEAERAEKERKVEEKQTLKRWRARLREINREFGDGSVDTDRLQELCLHLESAQLDALCKHLEGVMASNANGDTASAVSAEIQKRIEEMDEAARRVLEERKKKKVEEEQQRKKKNSSQNGSGSDDWSVEEMSMLAKGLQKYPGGAARRWHLIADIITTKTVAQVIAKAKDMSEMSGSSMQSLGTKLNSQAFENFMQQNKGALSKIEEPPDTRDLADAPIAVNGKSKTQGSSSRNTAAPAPAGQPPAQSPASEDDWTVAQQEALEQALKKYPASLGAQERWTAIANSVEGKNKKECVARFKQIRDALIAQKG